MGSSGCDRMQVRKNTMLYYIGKSSVFMLTKALAAEEKYVKVNMISPGILETSIVRERGPVVKMQDIVAAIMYVLTAKGVNGANIEVSNGWGPDIT
jgi:NAD(P)-dependent dehydrogenase (short-subunit alcohol dehydrogenase family)